jgi:hypothetical protein
MIYQLPTGKAVEIPLDMYLDMTDEQFDAEIQELIAFNYGEEYENSFHDSVLISGENKKVSENELADFDDLFNEDDY